MARDEDQRETFGLLLENKVFLLQLFITGFLLTTFSVYTFGNFFRTFYRISRWAGIGLVIGNTLGTLSSIVNVAAWILIDLNSWLDSCIPTAVVSSCFLICGTHFLISVFHNELLGEEVGDTIQKIDETDVDVYPEETEDQKFRLSDKDLLWVSLLTAINFFQGLLALLLLVFKCITLDAGVPTLTS